MRHSLWQSLQFAGRGLRDGWRSQRTMRVHVAAALVVAGAILWLDVAPAETAVLLVTVAAVLAAELFNTAVEVLVDLVVGEQHHDLAQRAKDLSAAAVLVTAVAAAGVGLLVLAGPALAALRRGALTGQATARLLAAALLVALAAAVVRAARRPSPVVE
ncbi:MAG: diacylglycerol kinase family protein [Armatimonadota bacterium]|nr:diacylglycerol kinase family protein [Armatimonadota bacterium]MDR7533318.1 diacylglycerol kinase family protein [Armatimonadota bacterium]MDR7536563.1 diacylglycerol kinase family protein [Armatimonadota bacterium]